jgi:hypothetical protein
MHLLTGNFEQFREYLFARRSLSNAESSIWIVFSAFLRVLVLRQGYGPTGLREVTAGARSEVPVVVAATPRCDLLFNLFGVFRRVIGS